MGVVAVMTHAHKACQNSTERNIHPAVCAAKSLLGDKQTAD
jgi:hypothetical protein